MIHQIYKDYLIRIKENIVPDLTVERILSVNVPDYGLIYLKQKPQSEYEWMAAITTIFELEHILFTGTYYKDALVKYFHSTLIYDGVLNNRLEDNINQYLSDSFITKLQQRHYVNTVAINYIKENSSQVEDDVFAIKNPFAEKDNLLTEACKSLVYSYLDSYGGTLLDQMKSKKTDTYIYVTREDYTRTLLGGIHARTSVSI